MLARLTWAALAASLCACPTLASAAEKSTERAYVYPSFSSWYAFVVDWNVDHTGRVAGDQGAGTGTWTDDGTQRAFTLDTPFSYIGYGPVDDCDNLQVMERIDTTQYVFRPVSGNFGSGTAQVVEIGTETDLSGCTPGKVTPFGSLTDPGTPMRYIGKDQWASFNELAPGSQFAGMTEAALPAFPDEIVPAVTTATFDAGIATFADTGDALAYTLVDGWIVVTLASGQQRAYARLTTDFKTGVESWLAADWSNGRPGLLMSTLIAEPNAAAGFGDLQQQAHQWKSGLFIRSQVITSIMDLLQDYTGTWIQIPYGEGPLDFPVTWSMDGANLVIHRIVEGAPRDRTWTPIANHGTYHFVYETEVTQGTVLIPPRVNFEVDKGPGTPP
jgi:hypothetical protein